jgi:hypothetical protein
MILDLPLILETRRNHALEHATMHILAAKYPEQHLAGHSNPTGFFILGKRNSPSTPDAGPILQPLRSWQGAWPGSL